MKRKATAPPVDRPTLRLRRLRKAVGLSQVEVAERLGKDQSAIARWEKGEAEPRLSELLQLAAIYKCSLGHLVQDGDGLSDEERNLVSFLRNNPVHRKILLSQLDVLIETVPTAKAK